VIALGILIAVGAVVFALLMAAYLTRLDNRLRQAHLRRRLGGRDADAASLLRLEDLRGSRALRILAESGLPWRPAQIIHWSATSAAIGALVGAFVGGPGPALLLGTGGLVLFPARILLARQKRLRACDLQMPQALQLMVLALRAGHALPGALALAARESSPPLRDELRQAAEEHSLGSSMGTVVERLAERLRECEAAQTFAVAILVLEQTGGNLISVIERIIDNARARTQYKAKLRALTAEGRWSAIILGMLPLIFSIIAGVIDPNYWPTLLGEPAGHVVLAMVLSLWACGGLWTWRLIKKGSAA
jgi:tight adherence protein B